MITLRRAGDRGHANHGWLDSHFTFSFADYHDPKFNGFYALRVINDDRVAPGQGFPTHAHRDMEIVTYVLEGAVEHKDSLGTGSVIRPGDAQRMSAGTGIKHSEFNPSATEPLHLLQIWIQPERAGLPPSYEQKTLVEGNGIFRTVASRDGRDGSVTIHQDATIVAAKLKAGDHAEHPLAAGRHAWVHVARGHATVNGHALGEGDGAAFTSESAVQLSAPDGEGEVLIFDLG